MKAKYEKIANAILGFFLAIGIAILILLCLLCGGCSKRTNQPIIKYVPIESNTNTRIIHTERIDTVFVEIPSQSAAITTRDSVSHLETDLAESYAKINSDGSLTHTLNNKSGSLPAPAVIPHDTVYVDKNIEVPYEVEVPKEIERELSRWEKVKMDFGGMAMGVAGALLVSIILLGYYLISHRKNTH